MKLIQNIRLCHLDEVLSYQNDKIPKKFINHFKISFEESKDIFIELKKWLWLCALNYEDKLNNKPNTPHCITSIESTRIIDEMWHMFILFTKDYKEFCEQYFNCYIHHFPEVNLIDSKPIKISKNDVRKIIEYVYENLGEETAYKWYHVYQRKYNNDKLTTLFQF